MATNPSIITRDTDKIAAVTGNLYESVSVISKRARQISSKMKEELNNKLAEFASELTTWKKCSKTENRSKFLNSTSVCPKQEAYQSMNLSKERPIIATAKQPRNSIKYFCKKASHQSRLMAGFFISPKKGFAICFISVTLCLVRIRFCLFEHRNLCKLNLKGKKILLGVSGA